MTTRRWAWKQPSFEESVIAHWSGSIAPKMYQGSSDSPKRRDLNVSVAGRSVNRGRFLVTRPGDIRSENADMSNEKSCEKHDRLPVEGFLRSVNLRRVNRSLRKPLQGVRWVHESDEVALTTEPCLSVGANWMIGLRLSQKPFPGAFRHQSLPGGGLSLFALTRETRHSRDRGGVETSRKKLRIGRAILPVN